MAPHRRGALRALGLLVVACVNAADARPIPLLRLRGGDLALVRAYLELGGRGLMIERVQEGSLAAACGLRANDIVLEVGGREVASPADVAVALGGIKKGAKVRVAYLRKGARLVAEADKQHDAAAAPSAREPLRERK